MAKSFVSPLHTTPLPTLAVAGLLLLAMLGCGHGGHGDDGMKPVGLDICEPADVLLGCKGNTWPECAASCPPPDIDWAWMASNCASSKMKSVTCNCLTGECRTCELFVDCP